MLITSLRPYVYSLVARFLEGYNVTVLAYGQTSSGKSYTMGTDISSAQAAESEGPDRIGIIPRAVQQIFAEIAKRESEFGSKVKHEVSNSYVEIYSGWSACV